MEFPGNSQNPLGDNKPPKAELPKKDIQKVVTVDAVQRKKPLGRRFKELFFGGDAKSSVKYVVTDVLIPALKNMVVDAGTEGLKRSVYGESYLRRRHEVGRPRVSYNAMDRFAPPLVDRYSRRPTMLPDQPPHMSRRRDSEELILHSREEAETVIERLSDIIDKYDVVTIADLHDLVGLPTTYVDNKWGWSVLKYATVRQVHEGYLLDLPPVEPIQ